jgi:hypothetical protein
MPFLIRAITLHRTSDEGKACILVNIHVHIRYATVLGVEDNKRFQADITGFQKYPSMVTNEILNISGFPGGVP